LKREGLHKARETGALPDFETVFKNASGVRLVKIFGRGRFADFQMPEQTYSQVRESHGDLFSFSKKRTLKLI
jgi:hypothetical protein